MSGNVKEWVRTDDGFAFRGGAYNSVSFTDYAPGLQCDARVPAPAGTEVRLPSIGFRCCLPGRF